MAEAQNIDLIDMCRILTQVRTEPHIYAQSKESPAQRYRPMIKAQENG